MTELEVRDNVDLISEKEEMKQEETKEEVETKVEKEEKSTSEATEQKKAPTENEVGKQEKTEGKKETKKVEKKEEQLKEGRIYTIPLRKAFNVPSRKRAKKAMKIVKEFISRHEKIPLENIKISNKLNEKIWARGIQKPPRRVKVKTMISDTNVFVELHNEG